MKVSTLSLKTFLFIEPVLLLYACGFFTSIPVQRQFIYSRYSEDVGFPFSLSSKGKSACGQTGDVGNDTLKHLETKVGIMLAFFLSDRHGYFRCSKSEASDEMARQNSHLRNFVGKNGHLSENSLFETKNEQTWSKSSIMLF